MTTDTSPQTQHTSTTTPEWLRLARAAAIAMALWSILLQVTAGAVIPPVLILGIVYLGFVPFLTGDRRRLGMAVSIVTVVALAGNAPVILEDLANPESAPGFILTLVSVVAASVLIVSGLGAFFRWSASPVRAIAIGALAVFVVGAGGSLIAAVTTPSDLAADGDIVVTAAKIEFVPGDITAAAGSKGVWIENKDGIHHTFTIEELGVDLEIPALKAKRVEFDARTGTYEYICTIPGHENMRGTLTISDS